jgi:phosphoribosylformylglycinamidine synthase
LSGETSNVVILLAQDPTSNEWDTFKANMDTLAALGATGSVRSAYPVGAGGIATSLALMAFGNNVGLDVKPCAFNLAAGPSYQGSVLAEIDGTAFRENPRIAEILESAGCRETIALTIDDSVFRITDETNSELNAAEIPLETLRHAYESPLAKVYPQIGNGEQGTGTRDQERIIESKKMQRRISDLSLVDGIPTISHMESIPAGSLSALNDVSSITNTTGIVKKEQKPKTPQPSSPVPSPQSPVPTVVIPIFPGTNCEWDMERAFREAGARTRLIVFRNRGGEDIAQSKRELAAAIGEAQILALSGGFSAGDEPDGSGKFIANVLRSPDIADAVNGLIENRDGLILGICNGFQALIKLGLVPYGSYRKADSSMPTLTFNRVGRHVSRMVRTRVMANCSPWLALEKPGEVHIVPVSHGEGRLVVSREEGEALFKSGQVPFCYADAQGQPTLREPDNPNGSDFAIEGLCSPDGRILGKMGHSERRGEYVHVNIPGNKKQNIFEAGVRYFC